MKLTRLIPLVAAAALFAGCSPTSGTAAVVDGKSWSESAIDQIIAGCEQASGNQVIRPAVVANLVLSRAFDRLADQFGQVSDAALENVAKQANLGSMLGDEDCKPVIHAVVKGQLLSQMEQQPVLDAFQALDAAEPQVRQVEPQLFPVVPAERVPVGPHRAAVTELERLRGVMDELRVKCPWDAKQTHRSPSTT